MLPPVPSFLPSDSSEDEGNKDNNKPRKSKAEKAAAAASATAETPPGGSNNLPVKKHSKKDAAIPKSLRDVPKYLPNLPPKHTYLRTAVSFPSVLSRYMILISIIRFHPASIAITAANCSETNAGLFGTALPKLASRAGIVAHISPRDRRPDRRTYYPTHSS